VASQKNILKYFYSEKITYNAINEGCHIDIYGPNINNLLYSSISLPGICPISIIPRVINQTHLLSW
jgi:hypothetical protein